MKHKHVNALAILMLIHLTCFAQVRNVSNTDSVSLDESKDLQEQLVPLDSILDITIKNSPAIKFQGDLVDAAKSQVRFTQEMWTNNISGFVNYSTGNQNLITADAHNPGTLSTSNITNGYRAGVQLNLPLYEFVGRKARVNLYKAQLQSTIDKEDQAKQELTQVLIQQYYSLIYYRNLIGIRSDAKQSSINQYQVAAQEFKDGIIQASELSRLKSVEVNARADYEEAKREFAILYSQFQNLVGVPIQQLTRRR